MGVLTVAAKNAALDALTLAYAAAYEGDPGSGGTELDEQAITFAAASSGQRAASTQPEFSIEAGETVDWIEIRSSSGGAAMARDEVPAEVFTGAGTYTLTAFTVDLDDPA